MDTTTHWLRIFRAVANQVWIHQSRGIDADLVCSSPQHRVHVIDGAKPPPTVSGMKTLVGRALNHADHRRPAVSAGYDG